MIIFLFISFFVCGCFSLKRMFIEEIFGTEFDEDNSEHNKLISKLVDNNKKKYCKQYQEALKDFDMKIIFI